MDEFLSCFPAIEAEADPERGEKGFVCVIEAERGVPFVDGAGV